MKTHGILYACTFLVIALYLPTGLHAADNVKLLCGFEIAEMKPPDTRTKKYFVGKAWTGKKGTPAGWRFKNAKDFHITPDYKGHVSFYWTGSSRDYPGKKLFYNNESQGKYVLWRHLTGKADFVSSWGKRLPQPLVKEPPRRDPTELRQIMMLNTFGAFTRNFPKDWSGYDYLLVDVKSTDAAVTFAILLEDDECEPHLDRVYVLPAGQWSTAVFDLADATAKKLLDPSKMANIFLAVEKTAGATDILADNVRLAKATAKSKFPLVTDKRPWRKPFLGAEPSEPKPIAIEATPDVSPITLEEPVVIKLSPRIGRTRFSQQLCTLSAFDNRFMILGGDLGHGKSALVTTDGGKTWKGADGSGKATFLSGGDQGDRGAYICDNGSMLGVTINTCAGGSNRSDLYFRGLHFTGKGWDLSSFHLVDVDVRHCPLRVRLLRQDNGRIWAIWDHLNRHGRCVLRVKASDDNGESWYVPEGTEHLAKERVPLAGRAIVPYGKAGLAVLFQRSNYQMYWSHTEDGKTWSEPKHITKIWINAAVTLGEKEIFFSHPPGGRMAMSYKPQTSVDPKYGVRVMRLNAESQWVEEKGPWKQCSDKLSAPNLSIIGNRLCAAWSEKSGDQFKVQVALRGKDGKWGNVLTAASEDKALTNLIMPRRSPPNFVPLAWATKDKTQVKVQRIPIKELEK